MGADSGVRFTSDIEAADFPFDLVENGFYALSKYCLLLDKQLGRWYAEKNLSVEVVNLSKAKKYPNRDALRQANDIYLDTMRPFIIHYLKQVPGEAVEDLIGHALTDEQADKFWEKLDENNDIESAIDFSYFPLIIKNSWLIIRNRRNYGFAQRFNEDMTVQSMLWLIKEGRNSCEHRGKKDLDSEFVRMNLFLIADVLGKINRPDEQREVEAIRDELFPDTAERLEKAEKHLKDLESEKSETEKRLADVASKKKEYEKENAALSKQVDEKENQRKKLDRQLKKAKADNDKYKKDIAGKKQRLEASEAAQADYKKRFETKSKELKGTQAEWEETQERLTAAQAGEKVVVARLRTVQNLFMVAAIGEQKVQEVFQSVYPPIEIDSAVRILDRRGVDKKNYLLELLEQKQPTLIYVQSEEMVDLLLERVAPEKADVIGKCNARTSETEEAEILEKLKNGELIAVVSNTAFSTLTSPHCVEHFVFCHLVSGLDKFFKQCEPAFTSERNAYLHLIYNSEQDSDGLAQKYPNRKTLEKLYPELRKLAGTNGDFIRPENVYNELDIAKPGIETGLAIFEELQLLERNGEGIKLLPPAGNKLGESQIYRRGEKLKKETVDFQAFQLERSIDQIWEEMLARLSVDSGQILREVNTDEMYASVSEVENSQQPTETVENDSEPDDGDTEARQASKPARANAEVTEEQVREIRSRSAAGESNSDLAEEDSEKEPEVKQSEFWQPIRDGEFGALFAGKPVSVRDDGWISKQIRGVEIILSFRKNRSYVSFLCRGENRIERRDEIIALFPETDYDYYPRESDKRAGFGFHVINKGKDHPEDWDEIREKLVNIGTDIYNKIDESNL
ncbi:MAG: hypothetical protein OXC79_04910 [Candidatus Poribacteria bacterium]|nr:hypothetical protein [Candidatus Poribacteria bacterium]